MLSPVRRRPLRPERREGDWPLKQDGVPLDVGSSHAFMSECVGMRLACMERLYNSGLRPRGLASVSKSRFGLVKTAVREPGQPQPLPKHKTYLESSVLLRNLQR